jgi:hypothetical protein
VPLHWPISFPEVLVDTRDPGFDAIIGNPPFLGGQKQSGVLGLQYLAWLQRWDGGGVKGSADLAARFVLRAQKLLNSRGQLGYITTNTLVQGDTLEVGLAQAVRRGLTIRRGTPSHPWPSSSANLEIVDVWASRAPIASSGSRIIDGEEVPSIGIDLEPVGRILGRPLRLLENEDIAFQGSILLGLGFTMSPQRAQSLIEEDSRNSEVLRPYIIGRDLNQSPDISASRWAIDFQDWPLSRAEAYPEVLAILRDTVKPERDRNLRANYRDFWWRHGEHRPGFYRKIKDLSHVLALCRVSNLVLPERVSSGPIFSLDTVVFALSSYEDLAVLSSSSHFCWVLRYASTMRTDIRYAHSDVFLTLPRPQLNPPTVPDLSRDHAIVHATELAALGKRLDIRRRELMLGRSWGLTTTYNSIHNPAVRDPEIIELREIHEAIDHAVLAAYGWSDLDPQIGHHPTKIGTRWTVSREARFELLDRLLEENHRRHAAEESGT